LRIPKRVNKALDWAEDHIRVITFIMILVVVSVAALWLPALAAFVLGALVGGVLVRWRLTRRLARLRSEADDLLRENGALRHEKTMLTRGVITASGQLTQKLPIIPRVDESPEIGGRRNERSEIERHQNERSAIESTDRERPTIGGPRLEGPDVERSERESGYIPATERLPIIPWDDETSDHLNQDTPLMGVIRRRR
jgi:hypothetical protein